MPLPRLRRTKKERMEVKGNKVWSYQSIFIKHLKEQSVILWTHLRSQRKLQDNRWGDVRIGIRYEGVLIKMPRRSILITQWATAFWLWVNIWNMIQNTLTRLTMINGLLQWVFIQQTKHMWTRGIIYMWCGLQFTTKYSCEWVFYRFKKLIQND